MANLDAVGVYSLLVGLLYVYIGVVVGRRSVSDDARPAQQAFLVWWYGLGVSALLTAAQIGLFRADSLSVTVYLVLGQANLFLVLAALWGLLYYLLYLYTGTHKWKWPLTAFYFLFFAALEWLILREPRPEGIMDGGWTLKASPEATFSPVVIVALLVGLIGPQIGAAIAYLRLYGKLEDRTQRYRVAMVSGAILVWFGIALVGSIVDTVSGFDFTTSTVWNILSRTVGLVAVLTMLFAYRPPDWIQRRFGVQAA